MQEIKQQINYLNLIMTHLDRMSQIVTNSKQDFLGDADSISSGDMLFDVSLRFLRNLIPDGMVDDKYVDAHNNMVKVMNKEKWSIKKQNFYQLRNIINLLSRNKILLSNSVIGDMNE